MAGRFGRGGSHGGGSSVVVSVGFKGRGTLYIDTQARARAHEPFPNAVAVSSAARKVEEDEVATSGDESEEVSDLDIDSSSNVNGGTNISKMQAADEQAIAWGSELRITSPRSDPPRRSQLPTINIRLTIVLRVMNNLSSLYFEVIELPSCLLSRIKLTLKSTLQM